MGKKLDEGEKGGEGKSEGKEEGKELTCSAGMRRGGMREGKGMVRK